MNNMSTEAFFVQPSFFSSDLITYNRYGKVIEMPRKKALSKSNSGMPDFVFIALNVEDRDTCNEWIRKNAMEVSDIVTELADGGGKFSLKYSSPKGVYYASYTTPENHEHNPNTCFSIAHPRVDKAVFVLFWYIRVIIDDGLHTPEKDLDDW